MNVIEGEPNDRQMTTGNHTVRDIYCIKCGTTLGWKYVRMTSLYSRSHGNRIYAVVLFYYSLVFSIAGPSIRALSEVQRRQIHPGAQPPGGRTVNAAVSTAFRLRIFPQPAIKYHGPCHIILWRHADETPPSRLKRSPVNIGLGPLPFFVTIHSDIPTTPFTTNNFRHTSQTACVSCPPSP